MILRVFTLVCFGFLGVTAAWLVWILTGLITKRSPPAPVDTTELLKSNVVLLAYLELKGSEAHSGYEYAFWHRVQARAAEIALTMEPVEVVVEIATKHSHHRFERKYE